jgi:hypothetical protein
MNETKEQLRRKRQAEALQKKWQEPAFRKKMLKAQRKAGLRTYG